MKQDTNKTITIGFSLLVETPSLTTAEFRKTNLRERAHLVASMMYQRSSASSCSVLVPSSSGWVMDWVSPPVFQRKRILLSTISTARKSP